MTSVSNQIQSNAMELDAMLLQNAMESSAKIREIKTEAKEMVYAEKGDSKYDDAIDENGDGKITYKEYMNYCEAQNSTQDTKQPEKTEAETTENSDTGEKQIVIKNAGKSINKYTETEQPEAKIEENA